MIEPMFEQTKISELDIIKGGSHIQDPSTLALTSLSATRIISLLSLSCLNVYMDYIAFPHYVTFGYIKFHCRYVCVCICKYIYHYISVYIYIYIHMYIYIYTHKNSYVYIYIYIYLYLYYVFRPV